MPACRRTQHVARELCPSEWQRCSRCCILLEAKAWADFAPSILTCSMPLHLPTPGSSLTALPMPLSPDLQPCPCDCRWGSPLPALPVPLRADLQPPSYSSPALSANKSGTIQCKPVVLANALSTPHQCSERMGLPMLPLRIILQPDRSP